MCPFPFGRKGHEHVDVGDGIAGAAIGPLEPDGVADFLDAHLVDGDLSRVRIALYIGHAVKSGVRCIRMIVVC